MEKSNRLSQSQTDARRIDRAIADRLVALRRERGWSLDETAERSGVSRATMSRLENAAVSGSAQTLSRLCAAYRISLSQLMHDAESDHAALLRRSDQPEWRDPEVDFTRRAVSPPLRGFAGEAIEGRLGPDVALRYAAPMKPGQEHHVALLDGALTIEIDGAPHDLKPGDCLRYRLFGASAYHAGPEGARYFIFLV